MIFMCAYYYRTFRLFSGTFRLEIKNITDISELHRLWSRTQVCWLSAAVYGWSVCNCWVFAYLHRVPQIFRLRYCCMVRLHNTYTLHADIYSRTWYAFRNACVVELYFVYSFAFHFCFTICVFLMVYGH